MGIVVFCEQALPLFLWLGSASAQQHMSVHMGIVVFCKQALSRFCGLGAHLQCST
jgi:hypothetical protein